MWSARAAHMLSAAIVAVALPECEGAPAVEVDRP